MTRALRRQQRINKIKAMGTYMRNVMHLSPTPDVIARKATHPKCACWMCKRERTRDTRAQDRRELHEAVTEVL